MHQSPLLLPGAINGLANKKQVKKTGSTWNLTVGLSLYCLY